MKRDVVVDQAAVHRHDAAVLVRWLFVAAIVVAIVIVAMDNRADTRLGYAIGDAQAPTWIVIVAAALAGAVIGWLVRRGARSRI